MRTSTPGPTNGPDIRTRPLPPSAHLDRPWRIHDVAPDFGLEDVWALPTPGGRDDLRQVLDLLSSGAGQRGFPLAYRVLFAIRWRLGDLLGLDDEEAGLGRRVTSLRDRLPADLRGGPHPVFESVPFRTVYVTDDEAVAEIANRTVHGLMHLGWVEDPSVPGGHRGQMAVLVKPNGRLGRAYLAFIRPFRHLIVYPALLRTLEREWAAREVVPA